MSSSKGFTLIEVMVASSVLVVALLGVAVMSLTARGSLHRSGEQTAATTLTQQRIEWLRNQGYASSDLSSGSTTETLSGTYVGYMRTTTVTDDTPRAGVKQVTVSTSTPSGISFEVVTLVSDFP